MSVHERIKTLREEKGYSQKEFAKVLNISAGCLSKYETGKSQIPVDIIARVANILGVSIDYIVGRCSTSIDYHCLNGNYIGRVNLNEILDDILSLDKNQRKTLYEVITALKCRSEEVK